MNCADNNNATLGHNWFLNIANYLHERKNMNIKIMDSRNKICCPICFNGFTQCHACVVQTTTRYAGVHKKLYKKITNRITIRMFKSIVKKKGDFNGK